jgi:hypothetical protein
MDATDLYAAADRVATDAELLRARAHLLAAHGDRLRWRSGAARCFRDRLDTVVTALLLSAGRGAEVADRVRSVAAHVR